MVSGKNFFSKFLQAFKGKTEERPQREDDGHAGSRNAVSDNDDSYVRIIKARDEILALAEALISFSDLDSQQRECGEVFNTRIEREKSGRDAKLQVIPNEMNSGISRTFELFSQGLERLHEETEVLDEVDAMTRRLSRHAQSSQGNQTDVAHATLYNPESGK